MYVKILLYSKSALKTASIDTIFQSLVVVYHRQHELGFLEEAISLKMTTVKLINNEHRISVKTFFPIFFKLISLFHRVDAN
jgi:hypothetical protein